MFWVGGSGSQLGEEQDSGAIKMAMGAAASGAGAGGKALAGAMPSPGAGTPPPPPGGDPEDPNGAKTENELYKQLEGLTENAFLLILDSITDPHNLGACLRSADAAGVHAVIAPKDNAVGLTSTVSKVACGAAETVPYYQVTNLARTLKELQGRGIWLYGTAGEASDSVFKTDLRGPIGIVMGAEGKGLRRLTRESCDHLIHIPMAGDVSSLNVSVAGGICLFEAVRQRSI